MEKSLYFFQLIKRWCERVRDEERKWKEKENKQLATNCVNDSDI